MKVSNRMGALAVSLLLSSCGQKAELPAKKESKAPQKTEAPAKAAPQPVAASKGVEYRLLGEVSAQDKVVLVFKVPGTIGRIDAKPGMRVKKGQLLAELDIENYRLRAEAAKLRFEQAKNARAQADRDFKVEEELRQKDISSLLQFQNAEIAHRNAQIAEGLAENDLQTAKKALSDAHLYAPVDGVITAQLKYVGDPSTGGAASGQVFEMYGSGRPEIYLSAPESLLSQLKPDTPVSLRFPAINLTLPGKISRVSPIIRETDRMFLVVAVLNEADARVVPGLFAEALYVSL